MRSNLKPRKVTVPVDYTIDEERRLAVLRLTGVVRGEDGWAARERMTRDSRYRPHFDEIVDALGATEFAVTGDAIRGAATNPLLTNDVRRAFVAGSDEGYGIFRMFQSASPNAGTRVFRDLESAKRWLAGEASAED